MNKLYFKDEKQYYCYHITCNNITISDIETILDDNCSLEISREPRLEFVSTNIRFLLIFSKLFKIIFFNYFLHLFIS